MNPVTAASSIPAAAPAADPPPARTVKAVPGQPFAAVLDGAQSDDYVNTSHNARHGEVFALIRQDGREWHVYGTGHKRQVFEIPTPAKVAARLRDALHTTPEPSAAKHRAAAAQTTAAAVTATGKASGTGAASGGLAAPDA